MGAVSDVQTYLAAQGLVDGATGWTSVRRTMHDEADQLVVVTEDGGPRPEIGRASGMGDEATADVGVLVTVRAGPWDGDASLAKAQAIHDDMHGLADVTMDATTYIRVRAMTPEPVFAGFDDDGRPIHTIAFRLLRDQAP